MNRPLIRALVVLGAAGSLVALPAAAASAHPLGNFSVNHYDGLSLHPNRIDDLAIVDTAEIPTLQDQPAVDTDSDGTVSDPERQAYAAASCDRLTTDITVAQDGRSLKWTVNAAAFDYHPGAADLRTSRLTCQLSATADLTRAAALSFQDSHRADRVGWHEITAVGAGVGILNSPVPQQSVSDELRHYPTDLLTSPLGQRSAELRTTPGAGTAGSASTVALPSAGPLTRLVARADATFTSLVGRRDLTPLVGALALLLSLVLGAAHAALPGHGKTVMAAYLAGRRGRRRDALIVGATVTVTHTAGVLILGLLLTLSSAFAGEDALRFLGIGSGLLVAGIGTTQLRSALRDRRARLHALESAPSSALALVGAPAKSVPRREHDHGTDDHGDGHGHDHHHGDGHGHSHGVLRHQHHGHDAAGGEHEDGGRFSRIALIGMGIAGGLVPSPSALVVLLGAIALGRTVFGVVLVLGYGLGMAATLTAAGLLLVHARDRLDRLTGTSAVRRRAGLLLRSLPIGTATLVVIVGLGLVARGLASR